MLKVGEMGFETERLNLKTGLFCSDDTPTVHICCGLRDRITKGVGDLQPIRANGRAHA